MGTANNRVPLFVCLCVSVCNKQNEARPDGVGVTCCLRAPGGCTAAGWCLPAPTAPSPSPPFDTHTHIHIHIHTRTHAPPPTAAQAMLERAILKLLKTLCQVLEAHPW